MCKSVVNVPKSGYLRIREIAVKSLEYTVKVAMVEAVLESR